MRAPDCDVDVTPIAPPDATDLVPPAREASEGRAERRERVLAADLTDQTNYLPPRQVITIYLGLSTGLLCSILEQTVVRAPALLQCATLKG
jgi:hypothetical protein